jgi:aryl-phospho-beta-D-glucosidase BglC (GH1 family)
MSSTDARDQKTIIEALEQRFGKEGKNSLIGHYENAYLISEDFNNFKEMGMSVVRIPFTYMNFYDKNYDGNWVLKPNAFDKLDWIINECSERGIYSILDLHGAFGSQNGQDHSGEVIDNLQDVNFYRDNRLKQLTLNLWKEIANRYKNNPAVAGYDTLNEPGEKAWYN